MRLQGPLLGLLYSDGAQLHRPRRAWVGQLDQRPFEFPDSERRLGSRCGAAWRGGLRHCSLVADLLHFVPGCQVAASVLSVATGRMEFLRVVSQYSALGKLATCCYRLSGGYRPDGLSGLYFGFGVAMFASTSSSHPSSRSSRDFARPASRPARL